MKKLASIVFSSMLVMSMCMPGAALAQTNAEPMDSTSTVAINEVESSDANGGNDWVEIYNYGTTDVDISGWFVVDDGGTARLTAGETTALPSGTTLAPGEVMVLEENVNFTFGLGKQDEVTLYDANQNMIDSYSWTAHATGTYARVPDGSGAFVDQDPSKGVINIETVENTVAINEVDSQPDDWFELMNTGTQAVDVSGYEVRDNSDDHRIKIADGTTIGAGGYLLIDGNTTVMVYDDTTSTYSSDTFANAFGLGSGDSVRLYDASENILDTYSWTEHAAIGGDTSTAAYGRYPNGTGSWMTLKPTPGAANTYTCPVVINEVNASGQDWVELANPTDSEIDISGIVMKDSKDSHSYTIPDGTTIAAGGYYVMYNTEGLTDEGFKFGLGGSGDEVRLFQDGELIASVSWSVESKTTLGLYPDMTGTEYKDTSKATPGAANDFSTTTYDGIEWPGSADVTVFDTTQKFLADSSGLDFANGQLYLVDNGTGKFWVYDVAKDGSLTVADGFEEGKRVRFKKDANDSSAAGPDTEGITVDGNGMVYVASERDNSAKNVNYDTILMVDPTAAGPDLVAQKERDLTASLNEAVGSDVAANMGIESVEWISDDAAKNLYDTNTNAAFDPSNYTNRQDGVFLVALEENGHVYAYTLNNDGTATLISDINPGLGGAMALDYDTYENILWVMADNGYGNMGVQVKLNGTATPGLTNVKPPANLDTTANNEGFAIATVDYTVNSERPVYRFQDGVTTGALTIGTLTTDYEPATDTDWTRIGGKTRYDTNAQAVAGEFDTSDSVVIAYGGNFPDALAASGLAGTLGAPVLLTEKDSIPDSVVSEIEKLGAKNAYVVGGTGVISDNVVNELESMNLTVTRISGKTRYSTAVQIYENGKGNWGNTAIVVSGTSYADALSASPLAWAEKYPIFLAGEDGTLDSATAKAISEGGFDNVLLVGGTARISDSVKSQVGSANCTRLSGASRYETSAVAAKYSVENSTKLSYDNLFVATGQNFPDALGGGALAGKRGTVLILADEAARSGNHGEYCTTEIVAANKDEICTGTFLGGAGAISEEFAATVEAASKN
ncbi:MAG: lamin tail domain-containing protein [Coriobacteriales bacterium]|jgi:putative cell wall-binding protein